MDATISNASLLRRRPPREIDVLATFGTERDRWTVEVMMPQTRSTPFAFWITPPRPVITSATVLDGSVRRATYRVRVSGPTFSDASRVLIGGEPVPTTPVRSSAYSSALTIGLDARVPHALLDGFGTTLQVYTPGAAEGGLSEPVPLGLPSVPLVSRPAFWVLVLALTSVGIIVVGIGTHRVRARRASRREVAQAREQIADDLHDDIGSRLSGLALALDVSARTLPATTRHEVQARADEARSLLSDLRDTVWMIDVRDGTLRTLIERLRLSAESLLPDAEIRVDTQGDLDGPMPLTQLRHLLLFCKEALHNAARHGSPSCVALRVAVAPEGQVSVAVADDGAGMDEAEDGRGMGSLRRRAAALDGSLRIDAAHPTGTVVMVTFPS